MYQSIYKYAKSMGLVPLKNKKNKKIAARILLDEKGNYKATEIYGKTPEPTPCPYIGTLDAQSKYANIICEKWGYILFDKDGYSDEDADSKTRKNRNKNAAWRMMMEEGAKHDPCLAAINSFLCYLQKDRELLLSIRKQLAEAGIKEEAALSFRVGSKNAESETSWEEWFNGWMADKTGQKEEGTAISCITGEEVIPLTTKAFSKIMAPVCGTGAYVASFANESPSLTSYGITDNRGTPMSEEESETIKAGLEFLLSSETNHSDIFNILYWHEEDKEDPAAPEAQMSDTIRFLELGSTFDQAGLSPEKMAEVARKREKEFGSTLEYFVSKNKKLEEKHENAVFTLMSYNIPSKGRISVYGEVSTTYGNLYASAVKWLADSEVMVPVFETAEDGSRVLKGVCPRSARSLYAVLAGHLHRKDAKKKTDQIKKEYGDDRFNLLDAALFGRQIPEDIFYRAVNNITTKMLKEGKTDYLSLQVIKAYLIRTKKEIYKNMEASLSQNINCAAYNLGRLLAVVEELQNEASNKRTIVQNLYRAAKEEPRYAGQEICNMQLVYVKKLERNRKFPVKERLETEFHSILNEVGVLPGEFTLEEKGAFDYGYSVQHLRYMKERAERKKARAEKSGGAA